MTGQRRFRTDESLASENRIRKKIVPFLRSMGFAVHDQPVKKIGTATVQTINAKTPQGRNAVVRVRLCWRPRGPQAGKFAAAQLRAKLVDGDWDKTLQSIFEHSHSDGITHFLIVERTANDVRRAALIPLQQLVAIWQRQRVVSDVLIKAGAMGRIRKNHAMNGSSPTIWLRDERTERSNEVADVLWEWPGVRQLEAPPAEVVDDTFDDCPAVSYERFGSDGADRVVVKRSEVPRDPRVRREVLKRAGLKCERISCGEQRKYPHFLDVHHILGADKSDRVWNCVALCPNCHRAAHVAPDSGAINRELLKYAEKFDPSRRKKADRGLTVATS